MMIKNITKTELEGLVDFKQHQQRVRTAVDTAMQSPEAWVRFLARYTSWNGYFGSGVATLSGKIGRCRGFFRDPDQPLNSIADRSVFVASFFFDAARDEFDDRDTVQRDTHRCLAQATLLATCNYFAKEDPRFADPEWLNRLMGVPHWLSQVNAHVGAGYGSHSLDNSDHLYRGMGYHLGSELLADCEFSLIDEALKKALPDLVAFLQTHKVNVAGQEHVGYQWIAIHSGHGNAVEVDHFKWATEGVHRAFRYSETEHLPDHRVSLFKGFISFAADHKTFFETVNSTRSWMIKGGDAHE